MLLSVVYTTVAAPSLNQGACSDFPILCIVPYLVPVKFYRQWGTACVNLKYLSLSTGIADLQIDISIFLDSGLWRDVNLENMFT